MVINKHVSFLYHEMNPHSFQSRIIDISCYILFILGFIGNVLGLFIFSSSRRTWRISSVYACLAICSSIINLLCVIRYVAVLHSTFRDMLTEFVGRTWWGCKIFEVSFSFRVISSWITLFWMFERLMCVSTRLRIFFNRCNSFKLKFIIPILIIIIILGCVIGPPVYMFQPTMILDDDVRNSTRHIMYCDVHSNASDKWRNYFHAVHLGLNHFTIRCIFSELFPAGAIIFFNSYIIHQLVRTHRHLHLRRKDQSRTTSWMNIVLILHSLLFLSSLFSHVVGHFMFIEAHETWWILLSVVINCSLNFYIYCLSGKAFRNEIRWFIHRIKTRLFHRLQTRQLRRQQHYCHNQRLVVYEMSNLQGIIRI